MKMVRMSFFRISTIFATTKSSEIIVDASWNWRIKIPMLGFIYDDMSSQLIKTLNFPKIMADLFGGFPKVNCDDMSSQLL